MQFLTSSTGQIVLWGAFAVLLVAYLAKRRARLTREE
jgi:hypothetical protein